MNASKLHIVAFDVPWPPHYGGICDLFFKLKHLHEAGVGITYHCFYYRRHNTPAKEIEPFCEKLWYYKRRSGFYKAVFGRLPYVVSSRCDQELLKNLLSDDAPILFDGLQTCYFLNHSAIRNRTRFVRANNVEHVYYAGLAKSETSLFRRFYLQREAQRLKKFEGQIRGVDGIFCVTKMDLDHFEKLAKTHYVPPFFNDSETDSQKGADNENHEKFVLFHGNLSVNENVVAARLIIQEIAPRSPFKFIIAGNAPGPGLSAIAGTMKNVRLVASPDQFTLEKLMRTAHINLLLTDQQTGIKLKLLHALRSGKHVLINSLMDDSGIFSTMCHVADESQAIVSMIEKLMRQDFGDQQKIKRQSDFSAHFDNQRNAANIVRLIT